MNNARVELKTVEPLPQHSVSEQCKTVNKQTLINKLNYINFQDSSILVNFKHSKYGSMLTLHAKPLPCSGDHLTCQWIDPPQLALIQTSYNLQNLTIVDAKQLFIFTPDLFYINEQNIALQLPNTCTVSSVRLTKRHDCNEVTAQITQNGVIFNGRLRDFTPRSMRVDFPATTTNELQWANLGDPFYLSLFVHGTLLYSGECRIIRDECKATGSTFVLEPILQQIRRFKPKEYRSFRQNLVPSPSIVFIHPFTGKRVSLKTINISGTGLSVDEDQTASVLLPGMILQNVEISFGGSSSVRCKAQVIYRKTYEDLDDRYAKCGMAYLDMDIGDHVRLLSYLQQAENKCSYICPRVDMDALWRFFFEAGFIYPGKYAHFEANKEAIKKTYRTLYEQSPQISRYFIYQEKGFILAHMAMMRLFENAWLIQHHAANKSEAVKAGLHVLNQVGQFINDSSNLVSTHMKYVLCYFRPDNKFPNRVFGGMARHVNDKAICSIDTFAYFYFERPKADQESIPAQWQLEKTQPEDLAELDIFYRHTSGGLMLDACDLKPTTAFKDSVSPLYQRLGLTRSKQLLSLKRGGILSAIIIVNISDIGLNMSNLANCPTIIVVDDDLPRDILTTVLTAVSGNYDESCIPVLMYPAAQAEKLSIEISKLYNLWVLSTLNNDPYFNYIEHMIKSIAI